METEIDPSQGEFNFAHDTNWRIFRIMAEFVDGFTFLSEFKHAVTFFGSARFKEDNPYYQSARELAAKLAKDKYTVITGGGPGIMEAANRGAAEVNGESVGLNIQLPNEQRTNPWVKKSEAFHYFYTRKVMLAFAAEAYIFFPGGFGTLDEYFEMLNLEATRKIEHYIPIIMFGREYWEPLLSWIERALAERYETITPKDLGLVTVVDRVEDAYHAIKVSKPRNIKPYHRHRLYTPENGKSDKPATN